MMPVMRPLARPGLALALCLVLCLALAACGERGEPPAAAADGPSPTVAATSAVPRHAAQPRRGFDCRRNRQPSSYDVRGSPWTPTTSATPTPISTESIAATPQTLAGYQALTTGLTALFAEVEKLEQEDPGADPQDADDLKRLVGDGVPRGRGPGRLLDCVTTPSSCA